MKTANTTDVTLRRRTRFPAKVITDVKTCRRAKFGDNVLADAKRRHGTKIVKLSPNDFVSENELTAREKTMLLTIHTDVTTRLTNIKRDAFHIGELLCKAKKILPHGKFRLWILCFFGNNLPYSTASLYMRIYEVFKDHPGSVDYFPSKCMLILTHKDFPLKVLQYIKENAHKFDNKSLKHIGEVYNLWKKGKIGGSKFLKLAKDQIQVGVDIARKSTRHRVNTITRMSLEFGAGDIFKRMQELIKIARDMAGVHPLDPTTEGYRQMLKDADKIIEALLKFKAVIEGREGMFRTESTENGDEVNLNL